MKTNGDHYMSIWKKEITKHEGCFCTRAFASTFDITEQSLVSGVLRKDLVHDLL